MKTFSFRLGVVLLLGALAAPAFAQPRNIGRFLMFEAKANPSYARIIMKNEAAQKAGPVPAYVQAEEKLLSTLPFAAHSKRWLWWGQTRLGISPKQAVLNLQKLGAYVTPLPKYPSLGKEYAWQAADFKQLTPRPATLIPPLPFYERRGYVYWAANLHPDGTELRSLLRAGLPKNLPAGALQASPAKAAQQARKARPAQPSVPVLVALYQPTPNAAPKVKEVLVWLQRGPDSRWHKVELHGDGFTLYPYFFRAPQK